MRDKIYAAALSLMFIALLLWCPGLSLLSKLDVVSLPENKNIKLPEKSYTEEDLFAPVLNTIEQTKADLENIYANCLPMYEDITMFMLDSERSMRETLLETLYSMEPEQSVQQSVQPIPADYGIPESNDFPDHQNIDDNTDDIDSENSPVITENPDAVPLTQYKAKLIGTDSGNKTWAFTEIDKPYSEGWTDRTLLASDTELRWRMDIQLGYINNIARANDDVNFYVYVGTRFQDTEIFGEIIKDIRIMNGEKSTKDLMDEFIEGLDKEAITDYDYFKIDTVEKRLERIFKTDHHESATGAYNIYTDIISMLSKNAPEIGEPLELLGLNPFDSIQLRGSHVWGFRYAEIFDMFTDFIIDLPTHTMYEELDGSGKIEARKLDAYTQGIYGTDLFNDHYANYYPRPAKIVYPENNTGRNLLIFGDSYTWAAGELIAANFDSTYITIWTHGEFHYNDFIKENNITDVLVMQVSDRLMFAAPDNTQLGKVVVD